MAKNLLFLELLFKKKSLWIFGMFKLIILEFLFKKERMRKTCLCWGNKAVSEGFYSQCFCEAKTPNLHSTIFLIPVVSYVIKIFSSLQSSQEAIGSEVLFDGCQELLHWLPCWLWWYLCLVSCLESKFWSFSFLF